MEAHGEDLRAATNDARLAETLKRDYTQAGLPPPERALLDFAFKLTRTPQKMSRADVEVLRKHGFTDRAVLEIVHIIGYFNYINRVADALGVDPEPEWSDKRAF